MNIENRVKALEQAKGRQEGVPIMVSADFGPTPEQTEAIQAAKAEGRPLLVLSRSDIDG